MGRGAVGGRGPRRRGGTPSPSTALLAAACCIAGSLLPRAAAVHHSQARHATEGRAHSERGSEQSVKLTVSEVRPAGEVRGQGDRGSDWGDTLEGGEAAGAHHAAGSEPQLTAGGGGGARPREAYEQVAKQERFIYTYQLPARFNQGITELKAGWHPEQYDIDQVLHRYIEKGSMGTDRPERAKLFHIPVYLGRFFNHYWQQFSDDSDPWLINKDCGELDLVECWQSKWDAAQQASSDLVAEAIAHVRQHHPYWNASEGADHFMVFSYDHARCDQARLLKAEDLGQLFSIQAYGSLTYRSNPKVQATERGERYHWEGARSWACYRPDVDVLVPVFSPYGADEVVSPFARKRPISMLLRFDYPLTDGKSLVAHHGHRLRKELIDLWEREPLPDSDLGLRTTEETEEDMRNAVFCVCPPGNTQDSARVWRAIILGCIPVTFFRANDLPFQRHLGLPYRDFVLNIQPDDYRQLNKRVAHLLSNPPKLRRMQEALERHQRVFLWDSETEGAGVYGMVERELSLRAQYLSQGDSPIQLRRRHKQKQLYAT